MAQLVVYGKENGANAYEVVTDSAIVGWLYRNYNPAIGISGYVGHRPGFYDWRWTLDASDASADLIGIFGGYKDFNSFTEARKFLEMEV